MKRRDLFLGAAALASRPKGARALSGQLLTPDEFVVPLPGQSFSNMLPVPFTAEVMMEALERMKVKIRRGA